MIAAIRTSQPENESDDYLIELMGLKADFPQEAMDAYGKIYSRYWSVMFTIAKRVTKDEETAGDLLADTFNMVYQKASTFKKGKIKNPENVRLSIQKWMTIIMQHIFYDHYLDDCYKNVDGPIEESYIIDKKLVACHFDDEYIGFIDGLEEIETSPDATWESGFTENGDSQNLAKVSEYLSKLSERDRDIVLTCYSHYMPGKYTPGTVLAELEKKWNTTRQNIRKILEKFRKAIKEDLQTTLTFRK